MHKKTAPENFLQGNFYKISMNEGSFHEGIFVSEDEKFIYIKLSSGYNIGISKKNILSYELLKKGSFTVDNENSKKTVTSKDKIEGAEILILHTGGTIASKVDYTTGAVNAKFTPEEMLQMFPELKSMAEVDSKLIRNMWSDDMRPAHYNIIAKEIVSAMKIKSLKGIILTHGTDTLHYTSSALSFIFEALPFPVVLVGSQRSSDRPSSDAASNLLSAAFFISKAADYNQKGVFICMHDSEDDKNCVILPPNNVRKLHSSRRDAFKCVNCGPVAKVNFERKTIDIVSSKNTTTDDESDIDKKYSPKFFDEKIKVGLIKSRPGIMPEELKVYEKFDGLILEGTGLGHFPIEKIDDETSENEEVFEEIKKISSKKIVCMTTQTIFGRVNMNVYSPGRMLREAGVLGHNLDMTSETAYIKLLWLLSNHSLDEAKELYSKNLRGEISERSEKEEFL